MIVGSDVTYSVTPGTQWTVEAHGLILRNAGGTRSVAYPAAAVWDLISRGYDLDKVISLMTHVASVEPDAARALVQTALEDWAHIGFLTRAQAGDQPDG